MDRNLRANHWALKNSNQGRYVIRVDGNIILRTDNKEDALKKFRIFQGDSDNVEFIDTFNFRE